MGVTEAEVDNLEPPTICRRLQQKVLRLEVSVRHVVLVQVLYSVHLCSWRGYKLTVTALLLSSRPKAPTRALTRSGHAIAPKGAKFKTNDLIRPLPAHLLPACRAYHSKYTAWPTSDLTVVCILCGVVMTMDRGTMTSNNSFLRCGRVLTL